MARWPTEPTPCEPKLSLPGFCFAYSTSSRPERTGSEARTTTGDEPLCVSATGTKALVES